MRNPLKRKPHPYLAERDRLLQTMATHGPDHPNYGNWMARLNDLDRMIKRATETRKALIPAFGAAIGVAGIYGLQQFGGVIVPKALETLAARQEAKRDPKELE